MIVEAREVSVRYPGAPAPALDGVSLSIPAGRLAALVGPNGSGKTTLVRALLGVLPAARGALLIDGRPAREWGARELAQVVGVVPQREDLTFSWRVDEVVMFGRYARMGALAEPSRSDRDAMARAMTRCDVSHLAARRVETLSGGEWQRVRIARALAQEPRALVLDEPTAALDVGHEMEVFELVRQLATEGLAALVITHHLNLAARYADHMTLLDGGRVAAEGTPTSVLQAPLLTKVFDWPISVTQLVDGSPQVVPERRPGWQRPPVA